MVKCAAQCESALRVTQEPLTDDTRGLFRDHLEGLRHLALLVALIPAQRQVSKIAKSTAWFARVRAQQERNSYLPSI